MYTTKYTNMAIYIYYCAFRPYNMIDDESNLGFFKYKLHISGAAFYFYSLSPRIQIIVSNLVKLSSSDNSKCSSVDECSPVEVR